MNKPVLELEDAIRYVNLALNNEFDDYDTKAMNELEKNNEVNENGVPRTVFKYAQQISDIDGGKNGWHIGKWDIINLLGLIYGVDPKEIQLEKYKWKYSKQN